MILTFSSTQEHQMVEWDGEGCTSAGTEKDSSSYFGRKTEYLRKIVIYYFFFFVFTIKNNYDILILRLFEDVVFKLCSLVFVIGRCKNLSELQYVNTITHLLERVVIDDKCLLFIFVLKISTSFYNFT